MTGVHRPAPMIQMSSQRSSEVSDKVKSVVVVSQPGYSGSAVGPAGLNGSESEDRLLCVARRHLLKRLARERRTWGLIGPVKSISGGRVKYEGRGDRFEFMVKFDGRYLGHSVYEVTLYSGGKSSQIYEV